AAGVVVHGAGGLPQDGPGWHDGRSTSAVSISFIKRQRTLRDMGAATNPFVFLSVLCGLVVYSPRPRMMLMASGPAWPAARPDPFWSSTLSHSPGARKRFSSRPCWRV